jgi:hypothetical protein
MLRFSITVERELIVYAENREEAEHKALAFLASITDEQPAVRPVKVVEVVEAPGAWPGLQEGPGK